MKCGACNSMINLFSCVCKKVSYCGKTCQRQDWCSHKNHCRPFKMFLDENRGRGLKATRTLNLGDLVISEIPLLVLKPKETGGNLFKKKFASMDSISRQTILNLHDPGEQSSADNFYNTGEDSEYRRALRIFTANSIKVCEVPELCPVQEGALYETISLLNHSCNPNVTWSWDNKDLRRKEVRVLKTIKKGEELVVNYYDFESFNFGTRDYRRNVLEQRFNFKCSCLECQLEGVLLDENEARRRFISNALKEVKDLLRSHDQSSVGAAMKQGYLVLGAIRELGLVLEMPRALLNYYQVARAAEFLGVSSGSYTPSKIAEDAAYYCNNMGDSFKYFHNSVCNS